MANDALVLVSLLLTFHQPEKVTWPFSTAKWGGRGDSATGVDGGEPRILVTSV